MKQLIILGTLLISISGTANAGFFDSFFGSKEEPVEETAAATPSADEPETSSIETATNVAVGLIPMLTDQLRITESQAQGGMGSLLGLAKESLSSDEFKQLGAGIPGMEGLLAAAPALSSKSGGGLGGMLSGAGGLASSIGGMALLNDQFEALGLDPQMISQIATLAIEYFSQDGSTTGELLQKGLGAILS